MQQTIGQHNKVTNKSKNIIQQNKSLKDSNLPSLP